MELPSTVSEALLRETREELAKADAKASILLAASGIAFAALLTVGSAGSWYPDKLSHHAARMLVWLAIALTLSGISFVAAAVKPRLRASHPRGPVIHYFADVEAYWPRWWKRRKRTQLVEKGRAAFGVALERACGPDEAVERLADQIWSLSHIAYRKYRLVSVGMWLYAGAVVSALGSLVVEKQWL